MQMTETFRLMVNSRDLFGNLLMLMFKRVKWPLLMWVIHGSL